MDFEYSKDEKVKRVHKTGSKRKTEEFPEVRGFSPIRKSFTQDYLNELK